MINIGLLIDGVLIGSIFALAAYGLALVWGVMNVKNLAQGDFIMLGGYFTWSLGRHHIDPLLGVPGAFVLLWGIGWVVYRLVISKVITRDLFTSLLATFGIAIVIQQSLNLAFGPDTQSAHSGLPTLATRRRAGHRSRVTRVLGFGLAVVLALAVIVFMKNSRMGQAIRATAQDARAARVLGIDTEKVYSFTFCLNAAICGAAGALVALVWNVQPFLGTTYSIRLFVIVTAAGFGNLPAVIAAGFGMGVFEQFGGFLLGAEFQQALIVLLLLGVLAVRAVAIFARAAGGAMSFVSRQTLPYLLILVAGVFAPFLFPTYSNEIAVLWLMIVFASTWDILGGQMGYNSLGNIFFFGAGMYVCAIVQIGLYYDVGMYTSGARTTHIVFTNAQYFTGFALGTVAAGIGFRRARHRRRLDRIGLARPLFRDRHARHRHRGGGIDFLLGMGRRRERHLDAGVSLRAGDAKALLLFSAVRARFRAAGVPALALFRPISA